MSDDGSVVNIWNLICGMVCFCLNGCKYSVGCIVHVDLIFISYFVGKNSRKKPRRAFYRLQITYILMKC